MIINCAFTYELLSVAHAQHNKKKEKKKREDICEAICSGRKKTIRTEAKGELKTCRFSTIINFKLAKKQRWGKKKKIIAVRRRKMCRKLDKMNAFAGTNVINLRHRREKRRKKKKKWKKKKRTKMKFNLYFDTHSLVLGLRYKSNWMGLQVN